MKILFITRDFPFQPNTGVKIRNWHFIDGLSEKNELTVAFFKKIGHGEESKVEREGLATVEVEEGDRSGKYLEMLGGLFSGEPFSIRRRFSPAMKDAVEREALSTDFDLVVCDSIYQACHLPSIEGKVIINEHNIESKIIERYVDVEKSFVKRLLASYECRRMKKYERRLWKTADRIFVCSEVDADVVKNSEPKGKVVVIPNGVDLQTEGGGDSEVEPGSIVYTGLIGWYPNEDAVQYFVKEIYPEIRKQVPNARFTVVGKEPSPAVRRLAEEDGSITVTGFVDDVGPYIRKAAVVVVPLRIGSGTRLKILEAFSMGKAVVSTSIGCEGLEIVDGREIAVADSPADFAQKTVELLSNKELCRERGEKALDLVKDRYTWDVIGRKIRSAVQGIA